MRTALIVAIGCSGAEDPAAPGGDDDDVVTDPFADIVPAFTLEDLLFEDGRVAISVPEEPTALLFVFHGSEGDIASVTQLEWLPLYNRLVAAGVGLVIPQSVDRVAKVWDTDDEDPQANADFPRLSRLRDELVATTGAEADTPILSIGFSNGANYALVFTDMARQQDWDVRAFSHHQGGARVQTVLPGIYVGAENDPSGQQDQLEPLAESCTTFNHRDCPFFLGHEVPLHPDWFARMPYYSVDESHGIFDELVDFGIVGPAGERLVEIEDIEDVFAEYLQTSQAPSAAWVPTQLRVVWATHRFSSEHAAEEAAWLLEQL